MMNGPAHLFEKPVRPNACSALLQPRDGRTFWLDLPPAAISEDFGGDFVTLLARYTWPPCVKSGRAACHTCVRVHRQSLPASMLCKEQPRPSPEASNPRCQPQPPSCAW